MEGIIFILTILAIVLLGRYIMSEGQRSKNHKKFMKNMNEFDSNRSKK